MNAIYFRPKVAELVFQAYGKPLHPELFDNLATRQFVCRGCPITVRITRTGHVITFQHDNQFLTEIADIDRDLPVCRRILSYRLCGERTGSFELGHGCVYQMSFQVEKMTPEIFVHVHDEILAEGNKRGLLHNFQPNHRLATAPLGLVSVDARGSCWFLNSFHTFPDEFAVVKTQSLIEIK